MTTPSSSADVPARFLAVADLHLGRRASRLPTSVDPERFSASEAWSLAVERACSEGVDVVLVAGDVVDRENRFFEAFGPLESGLRRLARQGIPTVAVAGNHDFDSLTALAREPREGLVLLGAQGRWERHTVEREGAALLHVDGWSFPQATHRRDPAAEYALASPDDGAPVVGLVHGDLGNPASPYAPLDSGTLRKLPPLAWILGHQHGPWRDTTPGEAALMYPGSLLALDPGEAGPHGAVLGRISSGGLLEAHILPLSRVRYEEVEVSLEEVADAAEARDRVARVVTEAARAADEEGDGILEALSCRIRLTGRTPLHGRLAEALAEVEELEVPVGEVRAAVDRVRVDTAPHRDLEALARGTDPPGRLAGLLLALEDVRNGAEPSREVRALLDDAARGVEAVREKAHYGPVRDGLPGDDPEGTERGEDPVKLLERQASLLLERLLSSAESAP